MSSSITVEEDIEVPLDVRSLEDFRRWALSNEFPQRGRIDYIDGRIEVDMSPEELYVHGTLKSEIHGVLWTRVKAEELGDIFVDSTRVSSSEAGLSAEPDIVVLTDEALDRGNVRRTAQASGESGRYVEIEGGPDLVVEVVSDSSIIKDTRRLPLAYFAAGVREFWLVDSRGKNLLFQIHRRGESAFEPVAVDKDGFQSSDVMHCGYRLMRRWDKRRDRWKFELLEKDDNN